MVASPHEVVQFGSGSSPRGSCSSYFAWCANRKGYDVQDTSTLGCLPLRCCGHCRGGQFAHASPTNHPSDRNRECSVGRSWRGQQFRYLGAFSYAVPSFGSSAYFKYALYLRTSVKVLIGRNRHAEALGQEISPDLSVSRRCECGPNARFRGSRHTKSAARQVDVKRANLRSDPTRDPSPDLGSLEPRSGRVTRYSEVGRHLSKVQVSG